MEIQFLLIASAGITTPRINHVIFTDTAEKATEEASTVVGQLAKAGYFSFDLFDTKQNNLIIASFRVEVPEPVVSVNTKPRRY